MQAAHAAVRGDRAAAARVYRGILAEGTQTVAALNNLAALLVLDGECAEAVDLASRAVDSAGPQSELIDTLASALTCSGRPREAIALLREGDPNDVLRRLGQAEALLAALEINRAIAALEDVERLLDLAPYADPSQVRRFESLLARARMAAAVQP